MATVTTVKSFASRLACRDCHTGKSALQPHHDAQVASRTFFPRCWDNDARVPARSGKVKSGASRLLSVLPRSAALVPSTHRSPAAARTTGCCIRRQKAAALTRSPSTKSAACSRGTGKQISSRHSPSGFIDQPVATASSGALIHRFSPSAWASAQTVSDCSLRTVIIGLPPAHRAGLRIGLRSHRSRREVNAYSIGRARSSDMNVAVGILHARETWRALRFAQVPAPNADAQPARRRLAGVLLRFLETLVVRKAALLRPLRLLRSASMRSITLEGCSRSAGGLISLPAALRCTSLRNASSYSFLNFDASKCPALLSRMWPASEIISFDTRGVLIPLKTSDSSRTS